MAQEATQRSRRTAELLVEAATEEFLAHGYAASSVRRICERAGRTTGSLYRIFDGKEALFTACVEPAVRALLVAFGSAPTPHGRMPEPLMPPEREVRLRAGLVAEAVMTHRAGVRLILRELDRPASRCVFARLTDAADQRLLQLLARLDPPVAPGGARPAGHALVGPSLVVPAARRACGGNREGRRESARPRTHARHPDEARRPCRTWQNSPVAAGLRLAHHGPYASQATPPHAPPARKGPATRPSCHARGGRGPQASRSPRLRPLWPP